MTPLEIVMVMSTGNPSAISVLSRMFKEGAAIDPDAIDPRFAVVGLDQYGIYAERIWMLHKDVCGEDLARTLGILRAVQFGIVDESVLNHAIDNRGAGVDLDAALKAVKVELPRFKVAA